MVTVVVICSVAFACALAATPLARTAATKLGFLDHPAERKLHSSPVPLLGGIAIYGAVLLSFLLLGHHYLRELAAVLVAGSCMMFIGLVDDRSRLPVSAKLAGQLLVAGGLYVAGVRLDLVWLPPFLNLFLSLAWIVGITNAMNLLDNMDGLSAGISAIAATSFTVMAAIHGQYLVGSLSAALLGACAGFLFFNVKPASIFMGDTGSLFLGLMLAVVGLKIRFPHNTDLSTWMVPVLTLGVPIFDTTLVFLSRVHRGVNPLSTPGRDHLSHRLVAAGWTEQEAVLLLYLSGGACGLLALFLAEASVAKAYTAGAGALSLAIALLWKLEFRPHA